MRVTPRVWVGLAAVAVYLVVILIVQGTSGIPYTDWGDSAANLWRGSVLSLIVGGAVLAAVTTWLGWWRPALHEQHRTRARWAVVAPVLMLLVALANLGATDWAGIGTDFVVAAVALGVFVGFAEELLVRGLLLTSLRSRLRELWAWFVSTLVFGLMHGLNFFLGQDGGTTLTQVLVTFTSGTTFYILRRVTGSLVWAMALHGLWDTSVFLEQQAPADNGFAAVSGLSIVVSIVSLVVVWFVIRDADEKPSEALTSAPSRTV